MRIVLDLQASQAPHRSGEIGRYSLSLARALAENRGDHEVLVALSGLFPDTIETVRAGFDGVLPAENVVVWTTPGPVRARDPGNTWRSRAGELVTQSFLDSLEPDVVHVTDLFAGWDDDVVAPVGTSRWSTAITLYDRAPVTPEGSPAQQQRRQAWHDHKLSSLEAADAWIATSEHCREYGSDVLGLSAGRCLTIPGALDRRLEALAPDMAAQVPGRLGLHGPYVICAPDELGPSANIERLVCAFAQLGESVRSRLHLAVVGRVDETTKDRLSRVARATGLHPDEMIIVGHPTDEERAALIGCSSLSVHPSTRDGIGLAAIEALSLGATVIGADTVGLAEIVRYREALFDPRSTAGLASLMHRALDDPAFRSALTRNSRAQAGRFSYERGARLAIATFERQHAAARRAVGRLKAAPTIDRGRHLAEALAGIEAPIAPDDSDWIQIAAAVSQNASLDGRPRQLLVDVSILVREDARTGIQRVSRAVLRELLEHPPRGYDVRPVYCDADCVFRYARHLETEFTRSSAPQLQGDDPMEARVGDVFLGLDLAGKIISMQSPHLSRLRDKGVKLVFLVHDLLPISMPEAFSKDVDWYPAWLRSISRIGDGIVCVSRTVADDLIGWLDTADIERQRPLHIGYSHNGADIESSMPSMGVSGADKRLLERVTAKPYLLMVGTIEPRKGHVQALEAFDRLWDAGVDLGLVIVGKKGWMVEELCGRLRAHRERARRLFWLERASDEMLLRLYSAATGLLAASEGEGFGLPVIEAARHDLSIIARDLPVFREVAGDSAYYFSGSSAKDLESAILDWLALRARGAAPSPEGIRCLTWAESTRRLVEVIQGDWYAQWPADLRQWGRTQ